MTDENVNSTIVQAIYDELERLLLTDELPEMEKLKRIQKATEILER